MIFEVRPTSVPYYMLLNSAGKIPPKENVLLMQLSAFSNSIYHISMVVELPFGLISIPQWHQKMNTNPLIATVNDINKEPFFI